MPNTIVISALVMGGLAIVFTAVLYFVIRRLEGGEGDEQIELLTQLLPGSNCGACGMGGCQAMARALAEGKQTPAGCPVASSEQIERISEALGLAPGEPRVRQVATVRCAGTTALAPDRALYEGVLDCRAADLVGKGTKGCIYGCLGLGTCARTCPFGAITMSEKGLPHVNAELCTGCGLCVAACPRNVIALQDIGQGATVRCVCQAAGKLVRRVCEVGCIGCGICVRACPHGAIRMDGALAVIDPALCQGCGACVEACPTGAIFDVSEENGRAVAAAASQV